MTLGQLLAELRNEKRITQNQMANLTNISRSRLSLYEIDKREPDIDTLKELSKFFNVSTDFLLGLTDIREKLYITGLGKISSTELTIIKKYRILDDRGKRAMSDTLNRECEFIEKGNSEKNIFHCSMENIQKNKK